MPTVLTIPLTAPTPLFFDPAWPLEALFLEILAGSGQARSGNRKERPQEAGRPNPYTLSPLWRSQQRGEPARPDLKAVTYHWRVSILDDTLTPRFLAGLKATETLTLGDTPLTVGKAVVKISSYKEIARRSQAYAAAKPKAARHINLQFLTPVILRRHRAPFPLPDPALVFRRYLTVWDAFAPPRLWFNINILDGIEFHLGVIEHQLESRKVALAGGKPGTGFVGQVSYLVMAWEKLGTDFLAALQSLSRFSEFCGSGALTERGLGQTRLSR